MTNIRKIESCRACKGPIISAFSLGEQYVIDFPKDDGESLKAPLNIVICKDCGLVQLEHTVDPDRLFGHFWYRSAISPSMKSSLEDLAKGLVQEAMLQSSTSYVLDIGCNDGTLLKILGPKYHRYGFEPSNLAKKASDYGAIVPDYFSLDSWRKMFGETKMDAITTVAMFYDLEDPLKFCQDLSAILKRDGVWVDQQNYLGMMIEKNGFDNIVHEHLSYHSLSSFSKILDKAGLEVFKVETNNVNGGSIRSYIAHKGRKHVDWSVPYLLARENDMRLGSPENLNSFFIRIQALRELTLDFIQKEAKKGRRIYVLGAGTRGNTILQWYGLDECLIVGAVDKNSEKWGRRIVGTKIPIMKRDEAMPDYFLVLPTHFLAEFEEQEKDWIMKGGRLIVPLPSLRVLPA